MGYLITRGYVSVGVRRLTVSCPWSWSAHCYGVYHNRIITQPVARAVRIRGCKMRLGSSLTLIMAIGAVREVTASAQIPIHEFALFTTAFGWAPFKLRCS